MIILGEDWVDVEGVESVENVENVKNVKNVKNVHFQIGELR